MAPNYTIIMLISLIVYGIQTKLSLGTNDSHSLRRRLVIRAINNFEEPYSYLKGVALISVLKQHGTLLKSHCTGTLIKPPPEARGFYVLTAAHCFYTRPEPEEAFEPLKSIQIEFGVIANAARGIMRCGVSDIRVSDEWPYRDRYDEISYDYAILTLSNCQPNNPTLLRSIQISMGDFNNQNMQNFIWAGYGGTRTLSIEPCKSLGGIGQNAQRYQPLGHANVLIHVADIRGGDSGGPMFFFNPTSQEEEVVAIVSATVHAFKHFRVMHQVTSDAVKLYPEKTEMIRQMISGKAGISYHMVNKYNLKMNCNHAHVTGKECWGHCLFRHLNEETCFETMFTLRRYAVPRREIPCDYGKTKILCGSLRECADTDNQAQLDKKCMGPCISNGDDTTLKCPAPRLPDMQSSRWCKDETGQNGKQYICSTTDHQIKLCRNLKTRYQMLATACWSDCHYPRESGMCYKSDNPITFRTYKAQSRQRGCGYNLDYKVSSLCDRIRNCQFAAHNEVCTGPCILNGDNHSRKCPSNRRSDDQNRRPCRVRIEQNILVGTKYLCHEVPDNAVECDILAGIGHTLTECWSPCHQEYRAGICYKSQNPMTVRRYVIRASDGEPLQKWCTKGRGFSFLCGSIGHCFEGDNNNVDIAEDNEQCQGHCTTKENAKQSCPETRQLVDTGHTVEHCANFGEFRWLCSEKPTHH